MTQTKHVEGGIKLSCKLAPAGNGKLFGKARHAGKKMIFPGVYNMFTGFMQWMLGGVYWMQVCFVATNISTSLDVLLSS